MAKPSSTESASSSLRLTESICHLDLFRVYRVAILLTASARRAEEAVTRAIESLDLNAMTSHGLLERTITAATEMQTPLEDPRFTADGLDLLPLELQEVAQLPRKLRQPFVLCVLLEMPPTSSARFLDLDASDVKRTIGLAAQMLARWSQTRGRTGN